MVSLLPAIAKALEMLVIQDLEPETELNNFPLQHCFIPGRSTVSAMRMPCIIVRTPATAFGWGGWFKGGVGGSVSSQMRNNEKKTRVQ
ncbi:Reverse transcriptase domain-containing protein [Aphis craccivora]|uniref:Reverse transcriptase domain-containing protein n=1 Tax=Aphis craccivora TaxID=307492 RepID=A0A6G0YM47_APHCR|nr:Reverse transcriptase domain-containing protein [Aphis craccivora]